MSRVNNILQMRNAIRCSVLTVLEGKKLEDAVHDGDDDCETQQVGVGFQKGHLEKAFQVTV